ncbi:MAG: DUF5011 domain-containing protein [Cellvibrionaceae bacterium]|nr:DUF5011 domain-containing protein [Cellvibrionaceae bacterium]
MAKRLQFCTAFFLAMSVFVTGCTVDVEDTNTADKDPSQSENPSSISNSAPVIKLIGDPVVTIPVNSVFVDPGIKASDVEDGDITKAVSSNSATVDTSRPGQYEITYRVTDSENVQAIPVKRLVVVSEPVAEPAGPSISRVEWVAVGQAGVYMPVGEIEEDQELSLSSVADELVNITAQGDAAIGSVHFLLTGPIEIDRFENNPPFALVDERKHLNVAAGEFPAGDYTLVVTPYSQPDVSGDAGVPHLVNFTVKGSENPPISEVTLVANNDSYTFQSGSDVQPGQVKAVSENDVHDGSAVFSIAKAPSNGSVRMYDEGYFTYTPKQGFVGTDSFTYQVVQSGKTASAVVSLKVEGEAKSPAAATSGFTAIKPSADSRLIYVSNSVGKDSNTCLTDAAPCKTIKAGLAKMRNGYPDHLYLKRGDAWRGESLANLHSGRSAAEPAVITYYGTSGNRPKLENAGSSMQLSKTTTKNFHIIGLEFYAYKMDPSHAEFTGAAHADITLLGGHENLLFEDNKFNFIELVVQAWEGRNPKGITLRRNIWTGAYYNKSSYDQNKRPSNLYMSGASNVTIEENVFDRGGWNPVVNGAGANMYNHNLYIQYNTDGSTLLLKNNIITRAASHGAQLRGGGLAEDNFFARNAVGLMLGYWEPLPTGVRAYAFNNVITEGEPMVKGKGACTGNGLCTAAVWGLEFSAMGYADWRGEGNYISGVLDNQTWRTKYKSLMRSPVNKHKDQASTVALKNNLDYKWADDSDGVGSLLYKGADRTLGSYNASLGGSNSFDEFMNKALNRQVGTWDVRYTASEINKYIRAGFQQ